MAKGKDKKQEEIDREIVEAFKKSLKLSKGSKSTLLGAISSVTGKDKDKDDDYPNEPIWTDK